MKQAPARLELALCILKHGMRAIDLDTKTWNQYSSEVNNASFVKFRQRKNIPSIRCNKKYNNMMKSKTGIITMLHLRSSNDLINLSRSQLFPLN